MLNTKPYIYNMPYCIIIKIIILESSRIVETVIEEAIH